MSTQPRFLVIAVVTELATPLEPVGRDPFMDDPDDALYGLPTPPLLQGDAPHAPAARDVVLA